MPVWMSRISDLIDEFSLSETMRESWLVGQFQLKRIEKLRQTDCILQHALLKKTININNEGIKYWSVSPVFGCKRFQSILKRTGTIMCVWKPGPSASSVLQCDVDAVIQSRATYCIHKLCGNRLSEPNKLTAPKYPKTALTEATLIDTRNCIYA